MRHSGNLVPVDIRVMGVISTGLNAMFCVLVCVAFLLMFMLSGNFLIKTISVYGEVEYNNVFTLRANVLPNITGNFFTIDLMKVKSAFEVVPWVRKAVIQREFPSQIRVTLEEHKSVAYWGDGGDAKLLNMQGEIFDANLGDVDSEDLPRLNGPEKMASHVLYMYQRLNPLFGLHGVVIDHLEISVGGNWHLKLEGGAVVELGRGDTTELVRRVENFLATYVQTGSALGRPRLDSLESADLRYNNAYAIRIRGITTLENQTIKK